MHRLIFGIPNTPRITMDVAKEAEVFPVSSMLLLLRKCNFFLYLFRIKLFGRTTVSRTQLVVLLFF